MPFFFFVSVSFFLFPFHFPHRHVLPMPKPRHRGREYRVQPPVSIRPRLHGLPALLRRRTQSHPASSFPPFHHAMTPTLQPARVTAPKPRPLATPSLLARSKPPQRTPRQKTPPELRAPPGQTDPLAMSPGRELDSAYRQATSFRGQSGVAAVLSSRWG